MTDKCRRRMNGREEYITTEITPIWGTAKKKREAQRKEGGSCLTERGWGFLSSSEGSLLPGTLGRLILYVFHPQNKPSPYQSPTFGPTLYKFITWSENRDPTIGAVCGKSCLCDDECDSLLRQGQTPKGGR